MSTTIWEISVDGAARHNPGPAGVGIVISKNHELFLATGFYVGKTTNNRAEYSALAIAVVLLKQHMHAADSLIIRSDSELLVKQMKGVYQIRDATLRALHATVITNLAGIDYKIHHIRREHNTLADSWANRAIDEKRALLPELVKLFPAGYRT